MGSPISAFLLEVYLQTFLKNVIVYNTQHTNNVGKIKNILPPYLIINDLNVINNKVNTFNINLIFA